MRRRGMRRHLFVSYTQRKGTEKADGSIFVEFVSKKRISPNDIRAIEKEVEEKDGLDSVIITNYQYF
ncbi:hypothetical protein FKN04_22555 [Bacillus glycinifermentans]|uniref:hypothetical protein n=1 Tax=Bacillus glycinifermentans TaxID=1664069 RepID=UPI0015815A02|nr:hypothetical protein [Bacillus glycinifermentans]NUJ19317.1 hypothetical protein [Bacillus glycinifermentans]